MIVNFYWYGNSFQFMNRLALISHVNVGHEVVVWLAGPVPQSEYWISDISEIKVKCAETMFKTIRGFKNSWNPRTLSTIFSYKYMDLTGEYFSDTDVIALKHWPDQPLVLTTYDPSVISVGVLRVPQGHPVLTYATKHAKPTWGNVYVFTKACQQYNLTCNTPINWFFPVLLEDDISTVHGCKGKFLDPLTLPKESYGYHFYQKRSFQLGITYKWVLNKKFKDSLLKNLSDKVFTKYPYINSESVPK